MLGAAKGTKRCRGQRDAGSSAAAAAAPEATPHARARRKTAPAPASAASTAASSSSAARARRGRDGDATVLNIDDNSFTSTGSDGKVVAALNLILKELRLIRTLLEKVHATRGSATGLTAAQKSAFDIAINNKLRSMVNGFDITPFRTTDVTVESLADMGAEKAGVDIDELDEGQLKALDTLVRKKLKDKRSELNRKKKAAEAQADAAAPAPVAEGDDEDGDDEEEEEEGEEEEEEYAE